LAGGERQRKGRDPSCANIKANPGTAGIKAAHRGRAGIPPSSGRAKQGDRFFFTPPWHAANPTGFERIWGAPNLSQRACTRGLTIDPGPTPAGLCHLWPAFQCPNNVYRTNAGGTTGRNIAANLPAAPVGSLGDRAINTSICTSARRVVFLPRLTGRRELVPGKRWPQPSRVDELFWMGSPCWQ